MSDKYQLAKAQRYSRKMKVNPIFIACGLIFGNAGFAGVLTTQEDTEITNGLSRNFVVKDNNSIYKNVVNEEGPDEPEIEEYDDEDMNRRSDLFKACIGEEDCLGKEKKKSNAVKNTTKLLKFLNKIEFEVWNTTEKGYKSSLHGYVSTTANFELNGHGYLAIGFSEGSIRILRIDDDVTSPNYGLPLVKDAASCDFVKNPELSQIVKAKNSDIKNSACQLQSDDYLEYSYFLSTGITVPILKIQPVPSVDSNGEIKKGSISLYVGFADTEDTKDKLKLKLNLLPNYTRTLERRPSVLMQFNLEEKNQELFHSSAPRTVSLSESTDEPGMYIDNGKDRESASITEMQLITTQKSEESYSFSLLVKGSAVPESKIGRSWGFEIANVAGYPIPIPNGQTLSWWAKSALGKEEAQKEISLMVHGLKSQRLYDVSSNYEKDKTEVERSANITTTTASPYAYYEGTKDGKVIVYFYVDESDKEGAQYQTLKFNGAELKMDGKVVFLDYIYVLRSLIIASDKGELYIIPQNIDGMTKDGEGFQQKFDDYPTVSFSNLDKEYLIFRNGSVHEVARDGKTGEYTVSKKLGSSKTSIFRGATQAKLSDDKSKLILSNLNTKNEVTLDADLTDDLKAGYIRVLDVNSSQETGEIDIDSAKESNFVTSLDLKNDIKFYQSFDVDFDYGTNLTYFGDQNECNGLRQLKSVGNSSYKYLEESYACFPRYKPEGVLIKSIETGEAPSVANDNGWRDGGSYFGGDKRDGFFKHKTLYTGDIYKLDFSKDGSGFVKISEGNICDVKFSGNLSTNQQIYFKNKACSALDSFELSKSNSQDDVLKKGVYQQFNITYKSGGSEKKDLSSKEIKTNPTFSHK